MSSSDSDSLSPQRVRTSFKKEQISSTKASPIVTAAARRQLRGGTPDQKSAAEIAAEYRRRLYEPERDIDASKLQGSASEAENAPSASSTSSKGTAKTTTVESASTPSKPTLSPPIVPASPAPKTSEVNGEVAAKHPQPRNDVNSSWSARIVSIQRWGAAGIMGSDADGNVGIGIKFVPNDEGEMTVTSLLPGAPADESKKFFAGDVIVAVGGVYVHGKNSEEVKSLIVGKPGTTVDLIVRKGKGTTAISSLASSTEHLVISTPKKVESLGSGTSRAEKAISEKLPASVVKAPEATSSNVEDKAHVTSAAPSLPATVATQSFQSIPGAPPRTSGIRDMPNPPIGLRTDDDTPKKAAPIPYASTPASIAVHTAGHSNPQTVPVASTPVQTLMGPTRAAIGIKFGIDRQDRVAVIDVRPGSPADLSKKVFPKNKILAVDGIDVFGKTAQEIEDLIAGPQGSKVELSIAGNMDSNEGTLISLIRQSGVQPPPAVDALSLATPPIPVRQEPIEGGAQAPVAGAAKSSIQSSIAGAAQSSIQSSIAGAAQPLVAGAAAKVPVAGAAKTLAVSPMSSSTAPSQLEVKRMTAPFLAGKTIDVAKDDSASPPQNQTAVQAIPPLKLIQPVQPAQPVVPFQGVTLKDFVAFESALTAKLEKIETSLRNQGLILHGQQAELNDLIREREERSNKKCCTIS